MDMAREVPFSDEGSDESLRKLGTATCKGLSDLFKPLDLGFRHDEVCKPNAR